MNAEQFKHLISAAATITRHDRIVVVGSQAILGNCDSLPDSSELLCSMEVDLFPLSMPEKADLIDGTLGEGSRFQDQFGCYAHGYVPDFDRMPKNWRSRLQRIEVGDGKLRYASMCRTLQR